VRSIARVYDSADFLGVENTPESRQAIGARICQAREAIGLGNRSEFGRRVGVTPTTVYRWERGAVVPDIFNLYIIARVLRVTMEWLVSGEERHDREALQVWLTSPSGQSASPEAISFLTSLPLLGYTPSPLFYELAYVAWKNGLTQSEAARAAKATEERRTPRQ
jgi:transcriptional regulator with XRE-family HTH domain